MHHSTWDLNHSIGIDVPFHCAKFKKILGANLEKIDKVDFRDIHTYIHTDIQTYIQTYRHTDIQTYRHTDIQTYIQTYRHTDIHTEDLPVLEYRCRPGQFLP